MLTCRFLLYISKLKVSVLLSHRTLTGFLSINWFVSHWPVKFLFVKCCLNQLYTVLISSTISVDHGLQHVFILCCYKAHAFNFLKIIRQQRKFREQQLHRLGEHKLILREGAPEFSESNPGGQGACIKPKCREDFSLTLAQ